MPADQWSLFTGIETIVGIDADGPEADALREQIEADYREACRWRENIEEYARKILDDPHYTKHCDDDVRRALRLEAQAVLDGLAAYRDAHRKGDLVQAANRAHWLGSMGWAMHVRTFEPLVKTARETHTYVGGRWVKVTPLEGRILGYFVGRTSADIYELFRAVWGRRFTEEYRPAVKTALSKLATKLCDQGVCLSFRLRGDQITTR